MRDPYEYDEYVKKLFDIIGKLLFDLCKIDTYICKIYILKNFTGLWNLGDLV